MHWVVDGLISPVRFDGSKRLAFHPDEVERFWAERQAIVAARMEERETRQLVAEERRRRHEQRLEDRTLYFSWRHAEELAEHGFVRVRDSLARPLWPSARGPYFPVDPLLALAPGDSINNLAKVIANGDVPANVHRARREGLTWVAADRWACALGFHPAEVWANAWWQSCWDALDE